MLPNLDFEVQWGYPHRKVAGVDEVGRGCLAGPVVAAALVLPAWIDYSQDPWVAEITDSKKLSAPRREALARLLWGWAEGVAVGMADVTEIDEINILRASHLAMRRAVDALNVPISHVLVDGNQIPKDLPVSATPIVKGDQKSLSIAASSIVAKVWRDRLMVELDTKYPGYGLASNKGYPTPVHHQALLKNGIAPIHRKSFNPVAQFFKSS